MTRFKITLTHEVVDCGVVEDDFANAYTIEKAIAHAKRAIKKGGYCVKIYKDTELIYETDLVLRPASNLDPLKKASLAVKLWPEDLQHMLDYRS